MVIDSEATYFQQDVCDGARVVAKSTKGPLAIAAGTVDKSLGVIIGSATGTGELARLEASSSHTAGWDAHTNASSSRARSDNILFTASLPNSPGALDPGDLSECVA